MFRPIALLALGLSSLACTAGATGADGPDGAPDPADAEAIEHYLMPAVGHSGYDGTNTFKVPVYTTMEEAVFEVEDAAIAAVEPIELPPDLEEVLGTFGKSWGVMTTTGPGTSTFSATAGDITLEATIEVLQYDPLVVAAGGERYNDPVNPDTTSRIACQSCHGAPDGVDHTPLALSFRPDAEILQIIAEGTYPEGGDVNGGDHVWNLTEPEAAGIVPYLRQLEPKGF